MNKSRFRNLTYKEKKSVLMSELKEKSKGFLTDKELNMIIRNIDLNVQYHVELVRSPHQMRRELTLIWCPCLESSPHTDYIREYGKVLLGNAGFILISRNNWNRKRFPKSFTERPKFSPDKKLIVTVEKQHIFIEDFYKEVKKEHRIVIYIPE